MPNVSAPATTCVTQDAQLKTTSLKEINTVERRIINPWSWQDEFGYVQANDVRGAQRTLYCSGQAANDAEGAAVHAGDMRAQIALAFPEMMVEIEATAVA